MAHFQAAKDARIGLARGFGPQRVLRASPCPDVGLRSSVVARLEIRAKVARACRKWRLGGWPMWLTWLACWPCGLATHLRGVNPVMLQLEQLPDPAGVFRHVHADSGLTPEEINQTLHQHLDFEVKDPGDTDGVVIEQTFDSLDKNYDDSLSRSEFLAGALRSSPASQGSLADIFSTIDSNGDGEISRTEFVIAAKGSKQMLGLAPAFRVADADGDGFLSQEEFLYIARQFYPRDFQTRTALVPLFHLLDSDSDGRISRIEFLKQADGGPLLPTGRAAGHVDSVDSAASDVSGGGEKAPPEEGQEDASTTTSTTTSTSTEKAKAAGPDWLHGEASGLKDFKEVAQNIAEAVRQVIRQELGKPLPSAATAAMEAAKAAGLPAPRVASAAAKAAAQQAAEQAADKEVTPQQLGALAATAAFRAARAAGLTVAQAAQSAAQEASQAAADRALAANEDVEEAAAVAAAAAFQAALDSGMSYAEAAQSAAEAAGRVISEHPHSSKSDVLAAAKAAQRGVTAAAAAAGGNASANAKAAAVAAATGAVGSAAAEEALAAGKAPQEAAEAAAKAVFSFAMDNGLEVQEAVSQSTIAATEAALHVAIAAGKTTQEIVDTAVTTAEETLMNLGNNTPSKKLDNAIAATRQVVLKSPTLAKLSPKQKLAALAAEAAQVAVEGAAKDPLAVAVLAANATLAAAAGLGLGDAAGAASSVALAAGTAAARRGAVAFASAEATALAARKAAQEVLKDQWPPQAVALCASSAAGLAAATSAMDTGEAPTAIWQAAALHAKAAAARLGLKGGDVAAAGAQAAALALALAKPSANLLEEAKEAALAAAGHGEAGAAAAAAAAAEAASLVVPKEAQLAAAKAATGSGGKLTRQQAVVKISLIAQLAGRAAQLAGMSPEEMAVVMGLEVGEALPKFDAHDGPKPMAEDATMAALRAAHQLGFTLKQLEPVAVHAAAGAAVTAGRIFFMNAQEMADLAMSAVLVATNKLPKEDSALLAAAAAGLGAALGAEEGGAVGFRQTKAAARAAQRAAAQLLLSEQRAARLAALAAGRSAGRLASAEKKEISAVRKEAAEAAVAAGLAAGLQAFAAEQAACDAAELAASEAKAYAARGIKKRPPPPAPKKDFGSLDGNGDGKVTANELKQWEPKDEFGSMEKNGDGEITMQEFQKFNPQHAVVKTGGEVLHDLLVRQDAEPAHWFAPGGLADPEEELEEVSLDGLHEAALRGDICLVKKHIDAGAPVNAPLRVAGGDEYLTLLHIIASKPDLPNGPQILFLLAQGKANPNARSTFGSTPLMFACYHKNVRIAELLLESEADPEAEDDYSKTAIRYAVSLHTEDTEGADAYAVLTERSERSAELVETLENHGGDLDNGGSRTPMAEAVLQSNNLATTRLLELGAVADGLVYAVAVKSYRVVRELINGGANPFAKNEQGLSCWEIATERGDEDIVACLEGYIMELERSRSAHLKMKPFKEEPPWTERGMEHAQWLTTGKSVEDVPQRASVPEYHGEENCLTIFRFQLKIVLSNPVLQAIMTTNLVLALFLPDFWVILAMQGNGGLDNALVMIFCLFLAEFLANLVAHGESYAGSYAFWTDGIGMLSVPLDHSLIADSFVDAFETSGLARVTKFAKLSARAVRLSRLAKLLRFLPSKGDLEDHKQGPAKGISVELMANLSIKVALLIIVLVITLPVIDFFRYPPDDNSLQSWTAQVYWSSKNFPDDTAFQVEKMREFYQILAYFPFQATFHYANMTQVIIEIENSQAPMRQEDVLVMQKEDTIVKFNFRSPNLAEAMLNVILMTVVILTILIAAGGVSSAVSHTVLSPIESLLDIVHSTAIQIFEAVEQMAIYFVKDYSSKWHEEPVDLKNRFSHEVQLLSKVLQKLDLLTLIANAKRPVDEFEQLGAGPMTFLQDYATHAALRHELTLDRREGQLEAEEAELGLLMESLGTELGPAEISRADFNSWELNVAELNSPQRMSLARCMIIMYDSAPGFEYGSVNIKKYKCHCELVKVLEGQYEDEQAVPYHNWCHAVDVGFTLRWIFQRINAERIFAMHERFGLMLAALAHDLGNSGVTNVFLAESGHETALLYNDQSCLQNMACAKLFRLLAEPGTAIFVNFDEPTRRDLRQVIVSAILHTDPACHDRLVTQVWGHYYGRQDLFQYVEQLTRTEEEEEEDIEDKKELFLKAKEEVDTYFWNADVKHSLRNFLVHLADASYPLKPWEVCSFWANAAFEEFFKQGDMERNYKMPMQPLNDRVRVNVPFAQVCYIKHVIAPTCQLLTLMLPQMRLCKQYMWKNLHQWLEKWTQSGPDHEDEDMGEVDMVEPMKSGGDSEMESPVRSMRSMRS
ncbi:unnamed protein product [Effrenium voratum]|uniref:Uncharacterized protein n=1 Tax=Effrenium voratum TaxID=2562239 RepID=A0AA36MMI1_9DINO|nr:unnamed protein product [Effrenium voratum]